MAYSHALCVFLLRNVRGFTADDTEDGELHTHAKLTHALSDLVAVFNGAEGGWRNGDDDDDT